MWIPSLSIQSYNFRENGRNASSSHAPMPNPAISRIRIALERVMGLQKEIIQCNSPITESRFRRSGSPYEIRVYFHSKVATDWEGRV